jgi:hypothetical protein
LRTQLELRKGERRKKPAAEEYRVVFYAGQNVIGLDESSSQNEGEET